MTIRYEGADRSGIPRVFRWFRIVILLFVLLVPEQATEHHLQILSELAQMFSDKDFRDQLAAAPDAASIHALFTTWDPNATNQRRAAV